MTEKPKEFLATSKEIQVQGIPDYLPEPITEESKHHFQAALRDLLRRTGLQELEVTVRTTGEKRGSGASSTPSTRVPSAGGAFSRSEELTVEERAQQYHSHPPLFDFDFLVLPQELREDLLASVDLIKYQDIVFDRWNLRSIEPFPRTSLNFHGPSGTGKTLAAHAVAHYLGKAILSVSYAHIESKYVGDGSKNIEAVFYAAQRDNAVLFIDEADSLLSRRLINVTQGAEQAINSMRSQLLICVERFSGVAIFATNLVENYDQAFEGRMRHLYFPLPDQAARLQIWRNHLPAQLPLAEDVQVEELAGIEGLTGRDIKNAVVDAALRAARSRKERLTQQDLREAVARVQRSRLSLPS